jgi:hypothetical protein
METIPAGNAWLAGRKKNKETDMGFHSLFEVMRILLLVIGTY